MFFRRDYATPGPGIDPNAPEKTGFARFFEIVQLEAGTIFKLNLLFLISCVPVVTIPLAIFAMNQVVRKMMLDLPVLCFYDYRTSFVKYWKQAYAAFFLAVIPLVMAGFGVYFYLQRAAENFLMFAPFMLCSTVFLVTLLTSVYLYGVLSTGRGIRESARMALTLGLGKPFRAVLAVLSVYGLVLFGILEFPISGLYLLTLGFSVPCLLGNFFLRTVLRQYCPVAESDEEAEEESKDETD